MFHSLAQEERLTLASCILFYSFLHQVDPQIVSAVIDVESGGNPYALGAAGDSGMMQIRSKYVPETRLQLFNPCTNVRRGVQLLKQAMVRCKHKADMTWIVCYNLGITGGSRIRYPKLFPYYKKMARRMK
jgi:soluble lytic murein transglycosylase-like protein